MELVYLLQGLNYPCTIDWYAEDISDESHVGKRKYTFSSIMDTINHFEVIHYVYEFKKVSPTHYKIAIL